MKSLKRVDLKHSDYFITIVTDQRQSLLHRNNTLFHHSFKIIKPHAYTILPDHIHFIINSNKYSISDLIHNFKITYSRRFRDKFNINGKIWQNRYWDHLIRDENDKNKHLDYIHWNAVKHGLSKNPKDWQYSSFLDFVSKGLYPVDWLCDEKIKFDGDFGE